MKSFVACTEKVERKWYVVDATGYTLGRLSSEIAKVLRGKNKPIFTPHIDTGDYVIVVNADKVKVTGKKLDQKIYYRHSDYVGGMKETTLREMLAKKGTIGKTDVYKVTCICRTRTYACSPKARRAKVLTGTERRKLHWLTQNIMEQEEEKKVLQEYI